MKINGKRLAIATVIELAVRTTSKIKVTGTKRGFGELTPEVYASTTKAVKDELTAKGMLNV